MKVCGKETNTRANINTCIIQNSAGEIEIENYDFHPKTSNKLKLYRAANLSNLKIRQTKYISHNKPHIYPRKN
jgi:predicted choloylglycine hydrolase